MFSKKVVLTIITAILILGGCGNSNSGGFAVSQISGTVATGEAASATVTIVGSNGETVVTNADSQGNYSADTTYLFSPMMIKAVLDRDGSTLYSFTATPNKNVNVTPLTSYIVNHAAVALETSGGASYMFNQFQSANSPSNIDENVQNSITTLNNYISTTMSANDVDGFDHFSDEFSANHEGYDALLDALDIDIYEDDVIIRINSNILNTLNYNIDVNEINASGIIYDITTDNPIANANITATDRMGNSVSTTTDINGSFTLAVETVRVYDFTITATGYEDQLVPNIPSFVFTETSVGDVPMLPTGASGTTALSGRIIDARTADTGISDATLIIRSGFGERLATPVATTSTDSNGTFSINLPYGFYTVEMQHDLYYKVFKNINIYGGSTEYDFSMLADLTAINASTNFFATITLNWDADPSDLDSHLTGPDSVSGRYHLNFANRTIRSSNYYSSNDACSLGILASLDRDRTSSTNGLLPETTTICKVESGGMYKYYVHHYSGTGTMSQGNAEVIVNTKNGTARTFTAPSTNSVGYHDIWHVFNMDSYGNIYPVNEMIGNDVYDSTIFASSSRSSEIGIFENLPSK
ncbi:carboxypeptidase regulatory-like domain-containing protein [Sulfurimonas lithotrophica]|uniref:Carboxypeptidase regulatory-like domain-containing protein n=1 Tax=Sulfurimonas lithotrophica TaxID=2590022 RepID=A0A5P8NY62_9BACT|nr:carboxypeptidase-like regulatory domain-containing protein [Sulfurimonas lithotrophica]QFR48368.1 carboxypeptidase regulatory-like domain-containing protein [Sulfurimonas lithotrophica]